MKGTSSTFNASNKSSSYTPPKEMIVIIRGSWNKNASSSELSSGIHQTGELQNRFMEFAKTHDIIDVQPIHQSVGHEIALMVRYKP